MAEPINERIRAIMGKLYARSALSPEELAELQTHVEQVETAGRSNASHHDTHSTPGSHYSQHHTNVSDLTGLLERIVTRK